MQVEAAKDYGLLLPGTDCFPAGAGLAMTGKMQLQADKDYRTATG